MTTRNEALAREAYEAYGRGDVAGMLEFVDPELEGAEQAGLAISLGRG